MRSASVRWRSTRCVARCAVPICSTALYRRSPAGWSQRSRAPNQTRTAVPPRTTRRKKENVARRGRPSR
eukprot:1976411-Pyramimonas_sp.AAC.1